MEAPHWDNHTINKTVSSTVGLLYYYYYCYYVTYLNAASASLRGWEGVYNIYFRSRVRALLLHINGVLPVNTN